MKTTAFVAAFVMSLTAAASGQVVDGTADSSQAIDLATTSVQVVDCRSEANFLAEASDAATSLSKFLSLRHELSSGNRSAAQQAIAAQLAISASPLAVRRLCSAVRGFATEDVVNTLINRLEAEGSASLKASLCEGLARVLANTPLTPVTEQRLLSHLAGVLENRRAPLQMLEAAVITCGQIRPAGFEMLCRTAQSRQNPMMMEVFYTALGESLDPRAAAVIRQGAADSTATEGKRIQAIHALGQLFAGWERAGGPVDEAERTASRELVESITLTSASDQLSSAALRAWAKIALPAERLKLRGTIISSLDSERPYRQEAALDVLYAAPDLQDEEIMFRVRQLAARSDAADSDGDAVSSTAKDVLESRSELALH